MGETVFVAFMAAVVSAIFSGGAGFWLATTRANTRLTVLEDKTERCLDSLEKNTTATAHRISVLLRIVIDLARRTPGFEFRTADIFEITSLEPDFVAERHPQSESTL